MNYKKPSMLIIGMWVIVLALLWVLAIQNQNTQASDTSVNLEGLSAEELHQITELQSYVAEQKRLRLEKQKLKDYCADTEEVINADLVKINAQVDMLLYTGLDYMSSFQ